MNTEGIIFGIQRFCVHDGPGIRTNVFLKGCNLHCAWCHNPESLDKHILLSYKSDKCVRCEQCVRVCTHGVHSIHGGIHELNRKQCAACGECCNMCPTGALELIGEKMTTDQLIEQISRDRLFFTESDGGLTVSGGEPMMQYDFLKELLKKARDRKIGTVIETNGSFPWQMYEALLEDLDILLIDYKHYDSEQHRKWTGIGNEQILENIRRLAEINKPVILRCPIIPGVNDTQEHFAAIAEMTKAYANIRYAELMPYHSMGIHKAYETGSDQICSFDVPKAETVKVWKKKIKDFGGRLKEEFK